MPQVGMSLVFEEIREGGKPPIRWVLVVICQEFAIYSVTDSAIIRYMTSNKLLQTPELQFTYL